MPGLMNGDSLTLWHLAWIDRQLGHLTVFILGNLHPLRGIVQLTVNSRHAILSRDPVKGNFGVVNLEARTRGGHEGQGAREESG